MGTKPNFNPETQAKWDADGRARLQQSGLTWDQVLGYVDQTWHDPTKPVNQDHPPTHIEIPGMGQFAVNYDESGLTPTSVVKVGGVKGDAVDPNSQYGDTMIGFAPGLDGKIGPISYAQDESPRGMLTAFAIMATMGYAAATMAGAGAAGTGAATTGATAGTNAAAAGIVGANGMTAAELAALGYDVGGMGLTGAGGIGTASSVAGELGAASYGAAGYTGAAGLSALPAGGMTATGALPATTTAGELGSGLYGLTDPALAGGLASGIPSTVIAPELLGTGLSGALTAAAPVGYTLGGSIMAGAPGTLSTATGLGSAATNFLNTGTGLTPLPTGTTPPGGTPPPSSTTPSGAPASTPTPTPVPTPGVGDVLKAVVPLAAAGIAGSGGSSGSSSMDSASRLYDTQAKIAQDQWDRYKKTYAPLEDQMVAEAQTFDSPAAYDRAAGEARSTTSSEYSRIKGQLDRQGLDPSSASYQSNLASLGLAEAASGAVGQNAARNSIKDRAWSRRTDALSLGKGLPIAAMNGLGSSAAGLGGIANANANRDERYAAATGSAIKNFVDSPGLTDFWKNLGGSSSSNNSGWVSGYDL